MTGKEFFLNNNDNDEDLYEEKRMALFKTFYEINPYKNLKNLLNIKNE